MAAIVGEELLASEAAGAEVGAVESGLASESSAVNELSGPSYRGFGVPENPYLGEEESATSSSSAFKSDTKPKGSSWGKYYNYKDLITTGAGIAQGITQTIETIYNNYRQDKQLKTNSRENLKDRYRAGIVFIGKENRDQLVRSNKMPAYYSTNNIKSLLRRGIMPFGWNSEMAIEQGFGKEIYAQEQKAVTNRNAKELVQRNKDKYQLQRSLGELKNLREKLKTRKLLQYYSQS